MRNEMDGSARQVVQAHTITGGVRFETVPGPSPGSVPPVRPPFGKLDLPVRGRDHVLTRLEVLLRPGPDRVALLHGLGGCGKTTIALALARRALERGVTVLWVSGATETDLQAGMRQVAVRLGAEQRSIEQAWGGGANAADLVWSLLEAHRDRWLLVIDNADDPAALGGVPALREGANWWREVGSDLGAVLVTSRYGDHFTWNSWCLPLRVEGLAAPDAAQVLIDATGGRAGAREDAESLATRLGGLPLALRLVGAYLAEASEVPWNVAVRTFADYTRALETGNLADDEPTQDLARTWDLSIDLLTRLGHAGTRPLLGLLCHFGDSDIPVRTLLDPAVVTRHPQLCGVGAIRLWKMLTELANVGLIDLVREGRDTTEPWVEIHPLVREIGRRRARRDGTAPGYLEVCARSAAEALEAEHLESPEDPDRWPFWRSLTPHVLWMARMATSEALSQGAVRDVVRVATACARNLRELGLYNRAADELTAIVALSNTRLGETDALTVDAYHCLASAHHAMGRYDIALDEYRRVLDIRRQTVGMDDLLTLPTRHQFAYALHDLGRLAEAEAEFRALLAVRREVSGTTDVRTLSTWQRWARVLHDQGDLTAAENQYVEIAAIQAEHLGPQHRHTLSTRHLIGVVRLGLGDIDSAEAETTSVLRARLATLGVLHPSTLITASQVALLHHLRGRLSEAITDYHAVLGVQTDLLGPEHPHTVITRRRLADVLSAQGQHAEADAERRKAFESGGPAAEGPGPARFV